MPRPAAFRAAPAAGAPYSPKCRRCAYPRRADKASRRSLRSGKRSARAETLSPSPVRPISDTSPSGSKMRALRSLEISPPRRGGDLIGARRAEQDLVRIGRIGPRGVNLVGHVAHAKGDAHVVELGPRQIAARNVDERINIRRRIGVERRKIVREKIAVADM